MKLRYVLPILIALVFALALSSCIKIHLPGGPSDTGGESEEDWSPKNETIAFISQGDASKYIPTYGSPSEITRTAATLFKEALDKAGLASFSPTDATLGAYPDEILFGETDRTASKKANELLSRLIDNAPTKNHWVVTYWNGKLAIAASSEIGYRMCVIRFFEVFCDGGNIVFNDTLEWNGSITTEEYEEYVAELERQEAEKIKAENAAKLALLLPLIEEQRDRITTGKLFGTATANIGNSPWGTPPKNPIESHPRLLLNPETLPRVIETIEENSYAINRFRILLDSEDKDACRLPEPTNQGYNTTVDLSNYHNFQDYPLELIQVKALGYLVYGEELYAYQALYYMKNYLETLDIVQIASDQCRQYGYVMFTAAIVYDWCYPILEEADKQQLIAAVENRLCRKTNQSGAAMEVGFPPSRQGSVTGHGAERQILRDYLAFATAIYGDNNSWWKYIAARVYNDYVPVRNYMFTSGIPHQGTGYATTRHAADLYSAWILKAATGENPYVGMERTMKSYIGYEFQPGYMFNDGDGTGDHDTTASFVGMMYMAAYLYSDSGLLAHANYIRGNHGFSSSIATLTSVTFIALTGLSEVEPSSDRYEGVDLIQYNGFPLGQYVIRMSFTSENSAAVLMRIKERYTGNHEHADSGTFEIYYKGMLTSDGGTYINYGYDHTQYYHQATISHNGLIIFNPSKWNFASSSAATKWYSGGQEKFGNESQTLSIWLNNKKAVTGTVTGRQHGYSDKAETKPLYAYIAGDITPAYSDDTVDYVGRRMLTVYTGDSEFPMVFFVYDDITSDEANYEKRFLLQISSFSEPTLYYSDKLIITENKNGRLVLKCLTDAAYLSPQGGRSSNFDASISQNYLINGHQLLPKNNSGDDGHWGRVEIVYGNNEKDARFMNVLYVTDAGNERRAEVVRPMKLEGLEGGVFRNSVVALFATSRERASDTLSCLVSGSGTRSYYVSGVAAGSWQVTVGGKDCGIYTATDEGGLLTFSAPAGEIVLTPIK